jgi:hypothetical protein
VCLNGTAAAAAADGKGKREERERPFEELKVPYLNSRQRMKEGNLRGKTTIIKLVFKLSLQFRSKIGRVVSKYAPGGEKKILDPSCPKSQSFYTGVNLVPAVASDNINNGRLTSHNVVGATAAAAAGGRSMTMGTNNASDDAVRVSSSQTHISLEKLKMRDNKFLKK